MRRSVCLAILMVVAVAPTAAAKAGARARLLGALPVHAKAGTLITVKWTVQVRGAGGKLVPFAASGMFVKLIGKGAETTAYALQFRPVYGVRIRVPRGGIHDIRIGLEGSPTNEFFPITNNPFRPTS